MDISNKKINFLGDSITEGVGVSSVDKVYWKLLESRDGCISRGYGIPVLDLYRTSGMQPEIPCNKELYMPDGLHPSDKGHELIYRRLRDFLISL